MGEKFSIGHIDVKQGTGVVKGMGVYLRPTIPIEHIEKTPVFIQKKQAFFFYTDFQAPLLYYPMP